MPRLKVFNFSKILMNGARDEKEAKPVIGFTSGGQMIISKAANHKWGLNGKAVDLVYDPAKRAFGFRVLNSVPMEDGWTKTMRLLKANEQGVIRVPVGRVFTALGLPKEKLKGLEVEVYEDTMERQTVYYVIIPKSLPF